jgi:hypothetical protein
MTKHWKQTAKDRLTLSADDAKRVRWGVDADFAVHPDFRIHASAIVSLDGSAITSISHKQGMSATEAEKI